MRHFPILLILALLLCGCASGETGIPTTGEPPTEAIPTESSAPATEPVDPIFLLLNAMSTEEKVGQLFLVRCPADAPIETIERYHPGGYILFGQDFDGETPDSFQKKLIQFQNNSPIPLLIAVDEEGGTVCRVSSHSAFRSSRFPSPRESYAAGGMEQVLTVETEKATLLRSLGISVNMGPVCDISTEHGAFMYSRSLGEDPEETGRFTAVTVSVMGNHGVGNVLKHFPGYGNCKDTHTEMVRDERTLEELENWDLLPFAAGIAAGCDAILVSHTIVSAMDDTLPASLSPAVHDYLRNVMGFDGVIVTDDLVMGAIRDAFSPEEAAVLAVQAGNDLLCSTEYALQYDAVLEAVEAGTISMERLEESVLRILSWKRDLGLIF